MMYIPEKFDLAGKDAANKKISHLRLSFELDDIKYLVIRSDDEIGDLVSHIDKVNGNKGTKRQVERLMTRIVTSEQIKSDF